MLPRPLRWLALFAVAAAGTAMAGEAPQGAAFAWPAPTAEELRLVRGALDIHAHLDPDSFGPHSTQQARALDVIDMARRARQLGMRGFVIKQHYDQTAQLAYVVRRQVPGIEVYGGVVENLTVGGLNPASVYHLAEVKGGWGRIVWMPTWDSENHVMRDARTRNVTATRPFITVSRDGVLTDEARAVIAAVAQARTRDSQAELTLETGHLSADEALLVVAEARRAGIRHVIVTHAFGDPVFMTIAQMQQAVQLGAMIEFVASYAMGATPLFDPAIYAAAMRAVGVQNVIISSDFGQIGRPTPPDALALFAGMMRRQGFSAAELHQMMAVNPAQALGLP
jgi:hypothetical protein